MGVESGSSGASPTGNSALSDPASQVVAGGVTHDPADPAWVWLPHYREASRRRRRRGWHRYKDTASMSRRQRKRKRLMRPLLAVAATLALFGIACAIL